MSPEPDMTFYLLSIRGKLKPDTLEAARAIHNSTAGASANVAAARALGDVSHMVFVPSDQNGPKAGEFLILDVWNSMDGLNQFFANPHVQEQAGQIFTERDPVVWMPATGFLGYHLPAPFGRNDRTVAIVRGPVQSPEQAKVVHDEFVGSQVNKARMAGNLSHEAYFRLAAPGTNGAAEFFAVDVWMDAEGMARHYADPALPAAFQKLFAGEPSATTWRHPEGDWVEW
jgi:quinol monooxygenase YgiN